MYDFNNFISEMKAQNFISSAMGKCAKIHQAAMRQQIWPIKMVFSYFIGHIVC